MNKLCWVGLADKDYYNYIAKFCLPSWEKLPGKKFIVHNDNVINFPFVTTIDQETVLDMDCNFLKTNPKKKTSNFWRKMQSQVWAIRNITDCDFLVLLDTDIEILDTFSDIKFNKELEKFKESNLPWATGRSHSRLHDSGFIILRMDHPTLKELTDYYENIWESGQIYKLTKSYDGHAVESMFDLYPSYKIMNTDYGKGFHLYDLGLVHYGSKIPKNLRANFSGPVINLVNEYIENVKLKKYKEK